MLTDEIIPSAREVQKPSSVRSKTPVLDKIARLFYPLLYVFFVLVYMTTYID